MAANNSANEPTGPPSIRQQQILDTAADNPEMPMEDLADEIPSATTELVERVLDEYGDPAEEAETAPEEPETAGEGNDAATVPETTTPDLTDLSPKQREVLQAIHEQPTATQQDLADTLDVSGPTVCNRVNSIAGFDWSDRAAFVDIVFDTHPETRVETSPMASNGTESRVATDQLLERVASIEQQLTDLTTSDENESHHTIAELNDPDLTHKVAHACLTSDAITEEEELQIIKALLQ